jgi:hypothetical protein
MSHEIHFTLDGEPETTHEHQLTPNFIIQEFGKKDPASNYLIQLQGHHRISYQDKGDEPIRIHNNERFQIISLGPTPVSDAVTGGLAVFTSGLEALGYHPEILNPAQRRIALDYTVETGKHAGKTFKIGLDVPSDFPLTPPSGPHVHAVLHPIGVSGSHPTANISDSPFGSGWQYWSRPFAGWTTSKKTVATYMAHIWRLWDSQ